MDTDQLKKRYQPKERASVTANPQVLAARFSPCGKFLVAGGYDGRVYRWQLAGDKLVEVLPVEGHGGWPQGIAFLPHEPVAVSADSWGQLRAWRYDDAQPEPRWVVMTAHDGWIRDVAVSPDGARIATCGRDQFVRIWSASDGALLREFQGHDQDVYCLRFHPDGKSLVSGDERGVVKHWDLETGECRRDLDASVLYSLSRLQDVGGVKVLAFDRPGRKLAAGGTTPKNGGTVVGTPTILIFDFETGQLEATLRHGAENDCYAQDLHWHEDGFVMAVTCGVPGSGKLLFQRPGDEAPFLVVTDMANTQSLSMHPDGKRIAVVATNRASNGNGRQLKNGEYLTNQSPIHVLEIGAA
jgi:WD40 repeat protein